MRGQAHAPSGAAQAPKIKSGFKSLAGNRGGTNIVLRTQRDAIGNVVRATFARSPVETSLLALVILGWAAYKLAKLYQAAAGCAACAAYIQANTPGVFATALAAACIAGFGAGGRTAARLQRIVARPWLAILPWSNERRRRDLHKAHAVHAAASALTVAVVAGTATHALLVPHPVLITAVLPAAYAAGFWLRRPEPAPPSMEVSVAQTRPAAFPSLFDRLDQIAPAFASRWAWSGRLRGIAIVAILLFIPLGGASAAVSMTRHDTITAFGVALGGANLVYLAGLRPQILVSAIFRAAPLGYARALAAVVRAPLLLSFAWFTLVCAVPLGATPASWPMVPGLVAALLLLNALYTACAAFRPAYPRQAVLLYAAGLYAVITGTATGGIPLGILTLVIVAALAVLLVRRGRRDWRACHG